MADSSPFVDVPKKTSLTAGCDNSPFKRLSFGGSNNELEALKIQVQSLKYELKESKNIIELNKIEHEKEQNELLKQLRQQQTKNDSISSDQIYYYNQNKELTEKLNKHQSEFNKENDILNKKLSSLKKEYHQLSDDYDSLQDEFKDQSNELTELKNQFEYNNNNSEIKIKNISKELEDSKALINSLKNENLLKDNEIESLKLKVNSLPNEFEIEKNQSVQKQLSEQIQYIKDLELKNLNQSEQIKKMLLNKQNIEILKDEKNSLLVKISNLNKLNDQINDLNLENLNLKAKISKWEIYLNEFEDIDSFFKNSKYLKDENLILANNFSKVSNDLKLMETNFNELFIRNENDKNQLSVTNEKYENLLKINFELEQQKSLLIEESNFLREELKNFDKELSLNENDRNNYIKSLENIINDYKNQLSELTKQHQLEFTENSNKRKRLNDDDDTTRNFQSSIIKLKDELLNLNNQKTRLTNENVILLKKLQNFESINEQKIRILQLRNNPFQNDQIIKKEKLEILEKINDDLLKKSAFTETVPKSIFNNLEFEKNQLETKISDLNKRIQRLKEMFNIKSLEILNTINSLFGFKLEFLSSHKIKLISKFVKNDKNYIIIDTANQTLKLNKFNDEDLEFFTTYNNLISFWIKEKNEVPCFLSALNLEMFEKEQTK